eukprot:354272-Chlamydomonas_euryale.AAC.2
MQQSTCMSRAHTQQFDVLELQFDMLEPQFGMHEPHAMQQFDMHEPLATQRIDMHEPHRFDMHEPHAHAKIEVHEPHAHEHEQGIDMSRMHKSMNKGLAIQGHPKIWGGWEEYNGQGVAGECRAGKSMTRARLHQYHATP